MDKLETWRGYVPDVELETYRKGGFAQRIGFGERVALLNIDTTHMFVDPAYTMCGRDMSTVVDSIIQLTALFRELDLPIYYSRRDDRSHPVYRGAWNYKLANPDAFQYALDPRADEWPESYGPRKQDRVVFKTNPHVFSDTARGVSSLRQGRHAGGLWYLNLWLRQSRRCRRLLS